MPRVIGLPATLAAWGCPVELVAGYATRGSTTFSPRGSLSHWTAGPKTGDRPSLHICTHGRTDLPGPLCNVFLTRAGVAVVVAAGRPNHAGAGSWKGLAGNSAVLGTEAENSGGGEWTAAQRVTYPRINAAFAMIGGFDAPMCAGHSEWAPTRKIDIRDYTMERMRREVAALLLEGPRGLSRDHTRLLQARVGATVDGVWGEGTTRAMQTWLGVTADGVIGPGSLKALQARVGVPQTGQWPDSGTIPALARYLDPTTTKETLVTTDQADRIIALLERIAADQLRTADAVTVGQEGVKFDGDVIAALKSIPAATITPGTPVVPETLTWKLES